MFSIPNPEIHGFGYFSPICREKKNFRSLAAKYFNKPLPEKKLYLEVAFWLGVSRFAILILPFRWIAPHLGTHMAHSATDENGPRAREIVTSVARSIHTMSHHLPWECKCLAQAISGKMMLRRRRVSSTLYLGVAKNADGELDAHAWLRAGKIILLGDGGLERFAVVSTFT